MPDPKPKFQLDPKVEQDIVQGMAVQAKLARCYYEALQEEGFTPTQAFHLVTTWVDSNNRKPPAPPPVDAPGKPDVTKGAGYL